MVSFETGSSYSVLWTAYDLGELQVLKTLCITGLWLLNNRYITTRSKKSSASPVLRRMSTICGLGMRLYMRMRTQKMASFETGSSYSVLWMAYDLGELQALKTLCITGPACWGTHCICAVTKNLWHCSHRTLFLLSCLLLYFWASLWISMVSI